MRPDEILRRSRRLLGLSPASAPPQPLHHLRTVVGIGPRGAFEGLREEVESLLPDGGPLGLDLLIKAYGRDVRIRVVGHGGHDVAFHVPEGGSLMADPRFQGHLARVHGAMAARCGLVSTLEWGDAPSVQGGLRVVEQAGGPAEGMPCVAIACASWATAVAPPGAIASLLTSGAGGPASPACAGAVTLHAIADTPSGALSRLSSEASRFARERIPLLPLPRRPETVLVMDMGLGVASTLSGETVDFGVRPSARPSP